MRAAAEDTVIMKKVVVSGLLGATLALMAGSVLEASRYLGRIEPPSADAVERPLAGFAVDPSWIKSGRPNFRATETVRSPDGRTITGLWACDGPTTFEWTFGLDETVHLLEGRVEIDYLGRHFALQPGDTATFHAGTKAVWHVPSHAKKAYTLHHPGKLVLLWRWLFPAST